MIMRIILFIFIGIALNACSMPQKLSDQLPDLSFAKEKQFQLAPPIIKSGKVFFEEENKVQLFLNLENSSIYYTLDGSDPTKNALLYKEEIVINESVTIRAKAFHDQFLPSETVETQFVKLGQNFAIKNISLNRTPHENYQGTGAEGLIDRKKGTTNFRTTPWMGFDGGDLEMIIELEQKELIKKVIASLLSDPASWIFLPEQMDVYASSDGEHFKLLNSQSLSAALENAPNELKFVEVSFSETEVRFMKIVLKSFPAIPDWHPGKGTPPWLFIDEILIE